MLLGYLAEHDYEGETHETADMAITVRILSRTVEHLKKVSILRGQYRKMYYAAIKERLLSRLTTPQKILKIERTAADVFSRMFSANSCKSQLEPQPKTIKTSASRCKAVYALL